MARPPALGSPARFAGQVAVVTGGSRGIGFAIAERLVREGATVAITGRKQDALDAAVEALGGPDHACGIQGRADDLEHQRHAVDDTIRRFGGLNLLVNNTGINPVFGPIVDLSLEAARKVFEVNCLAALSWVQTAYRAWMCEHGGSVVGVSSITARRPMAGVGFYGASKAMLASLTESLALELAPGIRVNAVAPGLVATATSRAVFEGRERELEARYPLQRLGQPEDIASAVAFLLSADAAWITGQTYVVDGGGLLGGSP